MIRLKISTSLILNLLKITCYIPKFILIDYILGQKCLRTLGGEVQSKFNVRLILRKRSTYFEYQRVELFNFNFNFFQVKGH